jgi:hypothetical protein
MKVIIETDLMNFNESDEASKAKANIIDHDAEDFEKRIERMFPDGISRDRLNEFIITYNECFREYYALCDRINEGVLDNAQI